jgi:hypothetical protein
MSLLGRIAGAEARLRLLSPGMREVVIRGGLTDDASGDFAAFGDEYVEREGGETVEAFQIRVRQLAQEAGSQLIVFGGLPPRGALAMPLRVRGGEDRQGRQSSIWEHAQLRLLSARLDGGAESQEGGVSHEGTYRFVPHENVPEMQAAGWELIGDMPGHHSYWSALMKFVEPTLNNEQTEEK